MSSSANLERFGGIHKSLHGDGRDIVMRTLRVLREMLSDRGCTSITDLVDPGDIAEAIARGGCLLKGRGPSIRVDVYFAPEDKVGVKYVRSILEQREEAADVVVVSVDGATPFTRKECEGRAIQFFLARDLCFNVTKHSLVPKHERVQEFPGTREELPQILDTDPIVQYYNYPPGVVLRTMRPFGGHEPIPYYRVVVQS